ncbi:MAG: type II toxin-antitoxin system VapC family toxin [Chloroflexota bacterium]
MSHIVVVDSDILIDMSRGVDIAIDCIERLEEKSTVAYSATTGMELIVGSGNKRELQSLIRFLKRFQLIPLNEQISSIAIDLLTRYNFESRFVAAGCLSCRDCHLLIRSTD